MGIFCEESAKVNRKGKMFYYKVEFKKREEEIKEFVELRQALRKLKREIVKCFLHDRNKIK